MGITIMSILAGVMTLNASSIGQQTAKREAERVAAYIQDRMRRADKTHSVVWFTVTKTEIEVRTGYDYDSATVEAPTFTATGKCEYSTELKLVYPRDEDKDLGSVHGGGTYKHAVQGASITLDTGTVSGTYLTVHGEDGKDCNVIIGREHEA